jgi:hypothetical protein
MGATTDDAKNLVDQLADQQQVLAAAQAKHAKLMLEFADTRRHLDQSRISSMEGDGADTRYTAGEFAALEIGLAITTSKHTVSRTLGIARRLKDETPDAWDAWQAGQIDQPRAARINQALIRLTRDSSKQLLNVLVVDVAVCKTVELLGRWLNEFIARVEPDQTNKRLRRSFEDRYVSIRPDIDGIRLPGRRHRRRRRHQPSPQRARRHRRPRRHPHLPTTPRRRLHRTLARQDQQRLPRDLERRRRRQRRRRRRP